MKIVHVSAECYPAAKAGGLADVVGALPKYQNLLGNEAVVVMPHYYNKFRKSHEYKQVFEGDVWLGANYYKSRIFLLTDLKLGFKLYSVEILGLFDRDQIYSYSDDTERFITFQIGVLNWINSWKEVPDIVHCHDQHSGFIPFMMARCNVYERLKDIPTIFTIHNGQYQGQFGIDKIHYFPAFHSFYNGLIEWDGDLNPMASAIKNAWKVTTVSPSYMNEIAYDMRGLENLLRMEKEKSVGILNGIDTDVWNPNTDSMLVKNFTYRNVIGGKRENKAWLCNEFNLDKNKPLFAFIGRLAFEKGADILAEVFRNVLSGHNEELNILVLGSATSIDCKFMENNLLQLENEFGGNYFSYIGYNERLSHLIYAGADFLLMPSRVEPCGLNQMYALRYGTVPIVRRTGGLSDTVVDIGDDGFGICHDQCAAWDVEAAIGRALSFYDDQDSFKKNQKYIMKIDHSWKRAAKDYIEEYITI